LGGLNGISMGFQWISGNRRRKSGGNWKSLTSMELLMGKSSLNV